MNETQQVEVVALPPLVEDIDAMDIDTLKTDFAVLMTQIVTAYGDDEEVQA